LTKAFDRIDHDRLTATLGSFPARGMIRGWLKASLSFFGSSLFSVGYSA
jgi:RNA-directed DNA polymerase